MGILTDDKVSASYESENPLFQPSILPSRVFRFPKVLYLSTPKCYLTNNEMSQCSRYQITIIILIIIIERGTKSHHRSLKSWLISSQSEISRCKGETSIGPKT
jgi:hypothetical protein